MRLATVFSGIGAIEHALDRMHINHTITFACDNGDIDILSKKISNDVDEIASEITLLQNIIKDISVASPEDLEHKQNLETELNNNSEKFFVAKQRLSFDGVAIIEEKIKKIISSIVASENVKKTRKGKYCDFLQLIKGSSYSSHNLIVLQVALNIINDFAKDNSVTAFANIESEDKQSILKYEGLSKLEKKVFTSSDNIDWQSVFTELNIVYQEFEKVSSKKIIKAMNDVAERLSMLHERITTFHIIKKLASLASFEQKKQLVDYLYRNKKSQNKVRESYLANYQLSEDNYHWNVSFLDGTHYAEKVDLFVGGSPCQSFSLVGKQRGLEDTRGTLFYEYARLIKEIRPKVFIYENVRAVLSNDEGKTWETMQAVFTSLGYNWNYHILNAKDYGIPQNRERLFVVGFRNDLELAKPFTFPKPIPLEKTMQDFLLDNVSGRYYLPTKGVEFVTNDRNLKKRFTQIDGNVQLCQKKNQQFNWHGDFVFVEEAKAKPELMQDLEKYFLSEKVRKYVLASGTKGFYSRPQTDLKIARPLLTTMHKMHRAGVDNYVTTDGRLRKLTPRECLRLMGFCDSFKIVVSDTSMYQQSGNAIVVDVLIAILSSIRESLPDLFTEEQ